MGLDDSLSAGFGLAAGAILGATAIRVISNTADEIGRPYHSRRRKKNRRRIRLL